MPSNFRNQIKSTQILTKQAPKANEKIFLTPKHFFSVTVPRLNQSYNFKGTCNLSRNLCNHVNFVFCCRNLQFLSVSKSSPSESERVRARPSESDASSESQSCVHCQAVLLKIIVIGAKSRKKPA